MHYIKMILLFVFWVMPISATAAPIAGAREIWWLSGEMHGRIHNKVSDCIRSW